MATEPSSAYARLRLCRGASTPWTGAPESRAGTRPGVEQREHPVPYVSLPAGVHRGERRRVPVADGGGDGDARQRPDATVPNALGSAQETICGKKSSGTPSFTLACVSHCSVRRFMSIVRLALV